MADPTNNPVNETPLPRAARRLLLETLQRGDAIVAAARREAQEAFQAAAADVLADLDVPQGAASELVRDGQGRPVAIRWKVPAARPPLTAKEVATLEAARDDLEDSIREAKSDVPPPAADDPTIPRPKAEKAPAPAEAAL